MISKYSNHYVHFKFKVIDNDTVFYEHFIINIMLSFDDLTILQFALIVMHCRFLQCPIDFKKERDIKEISLIFTFNNKISVKNVYCVTEMSILISILVLEQLTIISSFQIEKEKNNILKFLRKLDILYVFCLQ